MLNTLSSAWKKVLDDELQKHYFVDLQAKIETEYEENTCYPDKNLIFSAFNYCSFEEVKVVIIGQDPYHGKGEANGLCFSVNDGVKIPPSLRNILREINDDLDSVFIQTSGNLEHWAQQGVLLMNATLTVRENSAGSHQKLGWELFTDAIIQKLSVEKEHLVFLLWGNYALKKGKLIDTNKHYILTSGHPSPLSANQGKWFGNKHFSKINTYLKSIGKTEIDW